MPEESVDAEEAERLARLEANPYMPARAQRRSRKLTPGRKRAFIALIAEGASPTKAASEVGVSRQACYKMRASDSAFAEAWLEALEMQADQYEDALRTIAIDSKNVGGAIFALKSLRGSKWTDRYEVRHDRPTERLLLQIPAEALPPLMALLRERLERQTAQALLGRLGEVEGEAASEHVGEGSNRE